MIWRNDTEDGINILGRDIIVSSAEPSSCLAYGYVKEVIVGVVEMFVRVVDEVAEGIGEKAILCVVESRDVKFERTRSCMVGHDLL